MTRPRVLPAALIVAACVVTACPIAFKQLGVVGVGPPGSMVTVARPSVNVSGGSLQSYRFDLRNGASRSIAHVTAQVG